MLGWPRRGVLPVLLPQTVTLEGGDMPQSNIVSNISWGLEACLTIDSKLCFSARFVASSATAEGNAFSSKTCSRAKRPVGRGETRDELDWALDCYDIWGTNIEFAVVLH